MKLLAVAVLAAVVAATVVAVPSEGFPPDAATYRKDLHAAEMFPSSAAQHLPTGSHLHLLPPVGVFPASLAVTVLQCPTPLIQTAILETVED